MTDPVDAGGNRLLVTHQGVIYRVFRTLKHGSVDEGDCLVIRPQPGGGEILAQKTPSTWQ